MANKPKFLKNLLTTASAITLVAMSASSAMGAAARQIIANPANAANAATGAGLDRAPAVAPNPTFDLPVAGGSTVQSTVAGATYNAGGISLSGFNVNGKTGNIFNTGGSLSIGSVIGGATPQQMTFNVDANNILNFTGAAVPSLNPVTAGGAFTGNANDYSGVGAMNLSDNTTLAFTLAAANKATQAKFTGLVKANNQGQGVVTLDGNSNVYLAGGLQNVQRVTVADGGRLQLGGISTFSGKVAPAEYLLSGSAELAIDAGAKLTGTKNGNPALIRGAAAGNPVNGAPLQGTLTFLGTDGSTAVKTTQIDVESDITNLTTINIGNVIVQPGANTDYIDTKDLIFNSIAAPAVAGVANPNVNRAELALGSKADTNVVVHNAISTADGSGIISLKGNDAVTSVGRVGGDGTNAATILQGIRLDSDNLLSLYTYGSGVAGAGVNANGTIDNGTLGVASITTANNNKGALELGLATNLKLISDVGADGKSLREFAIHSNDGNNTGSSKVDLADGKTIYAKYVNLVSGGAAINNVLSLGQGSKVVGNVGSNQPGQGILAVKGDSQVFGDIAAIDSLRFDADGKTFTITGNLVTANGVDFTNNGGTLTFKPAANKDVTYDSVTNIGQGKVANLDASGLSAGKRFTVAQAVGTAATPLESLKGPVGGTLLLSKGSFIKNINMSGGDGTVQLAGDRSGVPANAPKYNIDNIIHDNEKTTLVFNGAAALDSTTAITLSTEANPLNAIKFTGQNSGVGFGTEVQIYTKNGITSDTNGQGILIFEEGANNIISGGDVGTSASKLNYILLVNNTGLEIKSNAYLDDGALIGDNSTLTLSGATFEGADISPINDANGTLVFNNVNAAFEYKGEINRSIFVAGGPTHALSEIQFNGQDVKLSGLIGNSTAGTVTAFKFTNANLAMNLDVTASGKNVLRRRNIEVASTSLNQSITVAGNQIINGNIGTAQNPLLIILSDDSTATVDTANAFVGFKTASADAINSKGTIVTTAAADGVTIYGIGEAGKSFTTANFDGNTTVVGTAYVKEATLDDTKTLTLQNIIGDSLSIEGPTAGTISFVDGGVLESAITTKTAGVGDITAIGNMSLVKGIGTATNYVDSVKFTGDSSKLVSSQADIFAKNTQFGAVQFSNTKSVNIGMIGANNGTVTATGTTFTLGDDLQINSGKFSNVTLNLNDSDLFLNGNSTASGTLNISSTRDGVMVLTNNSTLNASGVTAANITLVIDPANRPADGTTGYLINATQVAANKGYTAFTVAPTTKVEGSNYTNFSVVSNDANGLLIRINNNATEYARKTLRGLGASEYTVRVGEEVVNQANTGDAKRFGDAIENLSPAEFKKAVEQIGTSTSEASASVIDQINQNVALILQGRINSVNDIETRVDQKNANANTGVGAGGDESLRYGAWASPFYNQSIQKTRRGLSGYKVINGGGSFGFDALANDDTTIGLAMTMSNAEIKHRDVLAGAKTNISSLMFSIYGVQNFAENWFAQGIASFGSSKVKTKEKRSVKNETALGKYDSITYSGELTAGYNYIIAEKGVLVPMAGMRFSKFTDTGYTETGTTFQNRTIGKKSTDKVDVIAGVRAEMFATNYNGIDFAPEVHGFVNHDLRGKNAKLNISLSGLKNPFLQRSTRPIRTFYNLGLGLNAKYGNFEYGVGYDAQLANKYVGQTGSLKVRIDF